MHPARPRPLAACWPSRAPGAIALVAVVLLLAACGSADAPSDPDTQTPSPTAAATTPQPLASTVVPPGDDHIANICPGAADNEAAREHLPAPPSEQDWGELIEAAIERFHERQFDYEGYRQDYTATGDFLNYGLVRTYTIGSQMIYDDDEIPLINYDGDYAHNPLTIAQYALTMHGRWLHGDEERDRFLHVTDALIDLQDDYGGFRYPFVWDYYVGDEPYAPGWVSGLAQGAALSAFARAYDVTGEERYREAGNAALEFMLTPVEDGGTLTTLEDLAPELDGHIFISEYPHDPEYYTLNGFQFAMLGLYDWATVFEGEPEGDLADAYFDCTVATLELILPLYDHGGFTSYDLAGLLIEDHTPNLNEAYHNAHIYLLHALHSITGNDTFAEWEERWAGYVEESP